MQSAILAGMIYTSAPVTTMKCWPEHASMMNRRLPLELLVISTRPTVPNAGGLAVSFLARCMAGSIGSWPLCSSNECNTGPSPHYPHDGASQRGVLWLRNLCYGQNAAAMSGAVGRGLRAGGGAKLLEPWPPHGKGLQNWPLGNLPPSQMLGGLSSCWPQMHVRLCLGGPA